MIGRSSNPHASSGAVAAADERAAAAGAALLAKGGNAVDAALAAAAVMAVVAPHMCGIGGDMFALVSQPGLPPLALNGSGRAGSGADPERLRAIGCTEMPFRGHISSVTVPGCVAGWIALHERFASIPLDEIFGQAGGLARGGFSISASLARASLELDPQVRQSAFGTTRPLRPRNRLALSGIASILEAIARCGARGFYRGPAGIALLELGAGEFSEEDLDDAHADWVPPLGLHAFGHELWTAPPNSQGYLALSAAWMAQRLELPKTPLSEAWAFLLVEASRQAAFDRTDVLHERADGRALVAERRLEARLEAVHTAANRGLGDVYREGGTTHICAVDSERTAVSLIMSNAADFGSHLTLPGHGVFLHNRGIGFSLEPGHPAEYGPRRRPPHTLAPLLVSSPDAAPGMVLGTMGADAQPQILLQLLVRLLFHGESPREAVVAPRWILSRKDTNSFDTWRQEGLPLVRLEQGSPDGWASGLAARGYPVQMAAPGDQAFGHAQVIAFGHPTSWDAGRVGTNAALLTGAADPRAGNGAFRVSPV